MEQCAIFNKLQSYFLDDTVDEILINGVRATVVSTRQQQYLREPLFDDAATLLDWIFDFAYEQQVRLDALKPFAGGHTRDGQFRWHAVLPPTSGNDVIFSLRKTRFNELTLDAFADPYHLLPKVMSHIDAGGSLLVCGLPGAGKSTFLSALMKARCIHERVVVLEEVAEFQLSSPQWIHLVARGPNTEGAGGVSLRQLFFEALRLRPERMVLGEIRDKDDVALGAQMMSGMQKGLLATFHAGDLANARSRLCALYQAHDAMVDRTAFCLIQAAAKPLLADFISS